MKIKELTEQLRSFAQEHDDTKHISEKDIDRIASLLFRYLANMSLEEALSTFHQMIKAGKKANQIQGQLHAKAANGSNWKFWTWSQPIISGIDSIWQEAASIFNPFSTKL